MLQSDHQPHHSTINRPEEVGRMETMGYSKRSTASRNLLGWGWGRDDREKKKAYNLRLDPGAKPWPFEECGLCSLLCLQLIRLPVLKWKVTQG